MKISRIISENLLPNTIGAILFIGYFIVKDKLTSQAELETCERFDLSNTVYLIFITVIVLLSSLYQIIIGSWILKKNENSFALNMLNSVVFAAFFTAILVIMEFLNRNAIEVKFYGVVFLGMLFLALLNLALKKVCEKLFGNKFTI
jgi:heme/copper-type cytochrome/quinol oxidase subunit 3